jgi:hypothetical protein
MRAAIRGDFERLAERHGSQELMHAADDPASAADVVLDQEPPPVAEQQPDPAPDDSTMSHEAGARRSWLARLFGR